MSSWLSRLEQDPPHTEDDDDAEREPAEVESLLSHRIIGWLRGTFGPPKPKQEDPEE
jgi:hypothetical protein